MLSCLLSGFGDRLLSEVKKQAPKDIKIRVSTCQSVFKFCLNKEQQKYLVYKYIYHRY